MKTTYYKTKICKHSATCSFFRVYKPEESAAIVVTQFAIPLNNECSYVEPLKKFEPSCYFLNNLENHSSYIEITEAEYLLAKIQ